MISDVPGKHLSTFIYSTHGQCQRLLFAVRFVQLSHYQSNVNEGGAYGWSKRERSDVGAAARGWGLGMAEP
jgi:hypothetical protein